MGRKQERIAVAQALAFHNGLTFQLSERPLDPLPYIPPIDHGT